MRVILVWNMAHRATWNSDSNYMLIEGRKNGSLMQFSWIWFKNNTPIPQEQSIQNQISGKRYVGC